MAQGGAGGVGRSTATVLFTDLVGSTELRSRLGEDAAEALRLKHDALVSSAVETGRGKVLKNLGDGIMATFAGASDAVGAAVAIQQTIARHNRSGAAILEVRVGISAGDVVLEEDDCFGTPVIEAARLCGAARGGQILASEIVRWMARSGGSTFTRVGNLQLKGLSEPVPAVEVGWEPLPQSPVPLPNFLTDIGRIFVGRESELERLGQLWKEAVAGELRMALVAGEPGVGKTRLAAELARQVHDQGAMVLAGRCDDDLGVPYQPFVEALRHFVDHAAVLPGSLGRYGGELPRLVPELSERVPGLPAPLRSDPETERYRLFDAVASWLAATSGVEPLLVVLDDLHWAAKPTLMLLRHVVRAAAGGRVLILGIYRDSELTHDHPLIDVVADLRRQGGVERLSLGGLDDVGVAAIVEQAAGHVLDEDGLALARAVYQETEGNPFFVREVLRHLAETGAIQQRDGAWTTRLPVDQLGIPEGVREVVGHRLSRLSANTNQALRIGAVVGPEFELDVLQTAGDLGEETVLGAVEEAAAARLVTEVSATRFRFAHALVRATLYESLTAARKVSLHRRVAEAIETIHKSALDDYVPALAYHWAQASAPVTDNTRAVDYARRAGDLALAQLAHDEAAGYYASGLDLLDASGCDRTDPRRLELLIGRGEAQQRAGDAGYRQTLLVAAHLAAEIGDAAALARAALANTLGYTWSAFTVDTDRIEVLESALAAVGGEDPALRARLLATIGLELTWQPDPARRVEMSQEALAVARTVDDPATLAHVLLARDYTITDPNNVVERFDATSELLAIADEFGDPVMASRALSLRFKAAMELPDVTEAERSLARNEALVAELGQPGLTYFVRHHRATLAFLRGDPEAEQMQRTADELGRSLGGPEILSSPNVFSLGRSLWPRGAQGRAEELEETARQLAERVPGPFFKCVHAGVLADAGRTEAAARLFEGFAAQQFAFPRYNAAWIMFEAECARLCAHLGRADCVPLLRPMLEEHADLFVVSAFAGFIGGSVSLHLGLLATTIGDWPDAEARFAVAAAAHERFGALGLLARTHLEWARMLIARGDSGDAERAHAVLQRALTSARELGLAKIEREAVELLATQ